MSIFTMPVTRSQARALRNIKHNVSENLPSNELKRKTPSPSSEVTDGMSLISVSAKEAAMAGHTGFRASILRRKCKTVGSVGTVSVTIYTGWSATRPADESGCAPFQRHQASCKPRRSVLSFGRTAHIKGERDVGVLSILYAPLLWQPSSSSCRGC